MIPQQIHWKHNLVSHEKRHPQDIPSSRYQSLFLQTCHHVAIAFEFLLLIKQSQEYAVRFFATMILEPTSSLSSQSLDTHPSATLSTILAVCLIDPFEEHPHCSDTTFQHHFYTTILPDDHNVEQITNTTRDPILPKVLQCSLLLH